MSEILDLVGGAVGLYKVVPANEAHVRNMFDKKELFSPRVIEGQKTKSSYWIVPGVTKVIRLPLNNLRIDIKDVKLNDSNMAKFMCDLVCFVNISDPLLAAERTEITVEKYKFEDQPIAISSDFEAILASIGRTVATQQTISDIFKNRAQLVKAVTDEVKDVFPRWGLSLVDLEIIAITDAEESTIIKDIERKSAATISADARVKTAEENKRAQISEAQNLKEAELIRASTEEEYRKRQIEKDRQIGIAQQDQSKKVAEMEAEANQQKVEAKRKLDVGNADVNREVITKNAEAFKKKAELEAEGDAARTKTTGLAEAEIIKAKKVADAEGIEKLAEAQQKYNDSATNIEKIKAVKEIGLAHEYALQKGFEKATIHIVAGSTQEIFSGGVLGNFSVGAKEGVAANLMMETLGAENTSKLASVLSSLGKKPEKPY
jgi:uncharacterized membrane protein YqiK